MISISSTNIINKKDYHRVNLVDSKNRTDTKSQPNTKNQPEIKNQSMTIDLQLILRCAPVLTGIKAANTIMLQKNDIDKVKSILKIDMDFGIAKLYETEETSFTLLFRRKRLLSVMNQIKTCSYMLNLGYRPLDLDNSIYRLQEKMRCYHKSHTQFPNELGVFLEYPLNDIMEYEKHQGENYLLCGYWKVYENEEIAKKNLKPMIRRSVN